MNSTQTKVSSGKLCYTLKINDLTFLQKKKERIREEC